MLAVPLVALRDEGWTDEQLVTRVDAKAVADSGLVKSTVLLGGYQAPMEERVDSLIADMKDAEKQAAAHAIGKPKAIYVCKTNIVEGNSLQMDDPKQPFVQRRSPPILIWRHLTQSCGIDPAEIAVYCTLKTHKDYPLPAEFRLFKGGDKDYEAFIAGDFRHVIFNQSLQEGWDDPLVYFAYIDKSMESNIQVEQIIGRLLRQPGTVHYPSERLNGFGSRAHTQIARSAEEVVNAYIENVYLKQKKVDEYVVGPALVRKDEMEPFTNALHDGYSGLNRSLEMPFARAIDKTGLTWYRNPSKSGYNIPLISVGPTRNFYPDFLVWKGRNVFAIDTTGGHLLKDKTGRKLLSIEPATARGGRLIVRLISEGQWNADVEQEDTAGYTVWGRKQDNTLRATHVDSVENAVERALARGP